MDYLNIINKKKCSGCGACFNSCPFNAISMQEDKEGFLYPVIDKTKCTNCGLCKKVCPILNNKSTNLQKPACYAVMANDEIRQKSSSGGIFTLLAQYILDNGGYVCGAAYNNDFSVSHIIIDNKSDLDKLRGSKYVFSNTNTCFKDIKKILNNNKTVLFTGCPCQIAGLYGYLGNNYSNLITVELLCHGAPSYKVFKKYLDENFDITQIKKINFRDKAVKWRCDYLTIEMQNNEIRHLHKNNCTYEQGFHTGLFNRKSCAPCHFAKLPRQADITIADWWRIKKYDKNMDDTRGTSLVLINNKKANDLFNKIKQNAKKIKKISLEKAKRSPNITIYKPLKPHGHREIFFKNFDKMSFDENVTNCLNSQYDIGLVGLYTGDNFGTAVQYYCFYKTLLNLGKKVLMLDRPMNSPSKRKDNLNRRFIENPYSQEAFAPLYLTKADMIDINNIVDRFIVGSDQIFRYGLYTKLDGFNSLDWVKDTKQKYGYAISFGLDTFKGDKQSKEKLARNLQRFDAITTREKSGIQILKKDFGVDADEALDPVFLSDKQCFVDLIEKSNMPKKSNYLFAYILDKSDYKTEVINEICKINNLDVIEINNVKGARTDIYVEDWLKAFYNADYIITDSFHGVCFALIFEKEFLFIPNKFRGITRFETLIENFDIGDRMLNSINELPEKLKLKMNYEKTNKLINFHRQHSKNYLLRIIEETKIKPQTEYDTQMFKILDTDRYKLYKKCRKNGFYYKFKYSYYRLIANFLKEEKYQKAKRAKEKYKTILDLIEHYK